MEGLGSLLFIIIIAVISILGRLGQKRQADDGAPSEKPFDLQEMMRRMMEGQGPVRRAEPRVPADDGDWTPVAPPAVPRTRAPQQVRRQARPAVAAPPDDVDKPRLRPDQVKHAQPPKIRKSIQSTILKSTKILKPPTPQTLEQVMQKKLGIPLPKAEAAPARHPALQSLEDIRKGVILSEILGPPVSLR